MVTCFFILNGWYTLQFKIYSHVWKNRKQLMLEKKKVDKFKTRESVIHLYESLSPVMSTKELASPKSVLGKIFDLINIFFKLYYKLYMFVFKNVISKVIRYK